MGFPRGVYYLALAAAGSLLAACVGEAASGAKTAVFTLNTIESGLGYQVTVPCKLWITETEARAEVKSPVDGEMTLLVSKGNFYQLDPKNHRGVRGPLPPELRKSHDNFAFLVSKFTFDASKAIEHAKKVRTETVSGYLCDVLTNSATDKSGTHSITIWLPQKMDPRIPVKAVKTEKLSKPGADIERSITMILSDIKLNQTIPPSTFAIPSGYRIVAGNPNPPKPPK